MLPKDIKLGKNEYGIRLLTSQDDADVQSLCERCSDFSELIDGIPPRQDAGRNILLELPPDKKPTDKFVFGAYNNGVLAAVIDIVRDYKEAGQWIIGLLMIDPNRRRSGLGTKMHRLIKSWASEEGCKKLRLWVVEDNRSGYEFWRKMGYCEAQRLRKTYGKKDHTVIAMDLVIKGI